MNKTRLFGNLGVMAVLILLSFVPDGDGVFSLPVAWIGRGLRMLSLSGAVGNIAAIVLYAAVSLLPLLLLLKGKRQVEDLLLPLTSGMMFCALYYIINPGLRPDILAGPVGSMVCEGAVYSILLAWAVIRLVRYCNQAGKGALYHVLWLLLGACAVLCVFDGFGGGYVTLRQTLRAVREANTMPGLNLTPTYIFAFLRFLSGAAEYGLTAWVLMLGQELALDLKYNPWGDSCVKTAEFTAKWCRISLAVNMLVTMGLNLWQFLFAEHLHYMTVVVHMPLFTLTVALLALVVAGLIRHLNRLKRENERFI